MQIRELNLKELYIVYDVIKQLRDISYKEFEDLIYDMRHMDYKMLGILDGEKLITYAGVAIRTTFKNRRHLKVYDFVTHSDYKESIYKPEMVEFINDYAKISMCDNVIYSE